MNLLKFVAPATAARRDTQKEAAKFAAGVKPGHTYYSVVDCNWPWGNGRLLMEWKFGKPTFWSGGQPMSGHLSAAGVWLSYGPIHTDRPRGLLTFDEYRHRPQLPPTAGEALQHARSAEQAFRDARPTPAGV